MRTALRNFYINLMSLISKPQSGVYIMNGHYLSEYCNDNKILFSSLLNDLSKFCKFINVEEAISLVNSKQALNVSDTLLAFTFDDGFDDCYYSIAPALEEYNVNACFFINPNFINGDLDYINNFTQVTVNTPNKKPMTWEHITSLHKRGFIIGNHTLDHCRLSNTSENKALEQILDSKYILESILDYKCDYFAWPYGQFSDINQCALDIACNNHLYVFSGCDYKNYFSFNNSVYNRRHFEPCWDVRHLKYFLSYPRKYIK